MQNFPLKDGPGLASPPFQLPEITFAAGGDGSAANSSARHPSCSIGQMESLCVRKDLLDAAPEVDHASGKSGAS